MIIDLANGAKVTDYPPSAKPTDKVTVVNSDGSTFRVTVGGLIAQVGLDEFVRRVRPHKDASRSWDEDDHPRRPDGKFGTKGSPKKPRKLGAAAKPKAKASTFIPADDSDDPDDPDDPDPFEEDEFNSEPVVTEQGTPEPDQPEPATAELASPYDTGGAPHPAVAAMDRVKFGNIDPQDPPRIQDPQLESDRRYQHSQRRKQLDKLSPEQRDAMRREIAQNAQGKIHIRIRGHKLAGLADDGRMRTLHELGVSPDKQADYIGMRDKFERGVLGLEGTPDDQMPVYGYVGDPDGADAYGSVVITLKDSVRSRTSVTGGDSLNDLTQPYGIDKVARGLSDDELAANVGDQEMTSLAVGGGFRSYMEAQILGVSLADIDTVTIPPDNPDYFTTDPDDVARLRQLGVNVIQREPEPETFGLTPEQLKILGVSI